MKKYWNLKDNTVQIYRREKKKMIENIKMELQSNLDHEHGEFSGFDNFFEKHQENMNKRVKN